MIHDLKLDIPNLIVMRFFFLDYISLSPKLSKGCIMVARQRIDINK